MVLRRLFVAEIVLVLVARASDAASAAHIMAACLFATATLAVLLTRPEPYAARLSGFAFVIALVIALWAFGQSLAFEGNPFANAIWNSLGSGGGATAGSISIEPADTLQALLKILMPFAAFISACLLFDDDRRALRLLEVLAAIGLVMALVGLVQLLFFPDQLFFTAKTSSLDAMTGPFVNRNTAATYFAVIGIILSGIIFDRVQERGLAHYWGLLIGRQSRRSGKPYDLAIVAILTAALIFVWIALMLTKSRAGIASGVLGAAVFFVIIGYYGGYSRKKRRRGFEKNEKSVLKGRLLRVGFGLAGLLIGILFFAGRVSYRVNLQGDEDQRFCMYPDILRAISDHWLTGTGFGTFQDAFSPYRSAECGMNGIWHMAHSFYLEGAMTMGVLFVPLLLAVVGYLFAIYGAGLRNRRKYRWVSAVGISALITTLAHSTVDFSIQIPGYAVSFAAVVAATAILAKRDMREAPRNRQKVQTR